MPKTEIARSGETGVSRPRNIFTAMRDDIDRVFERFEHDWPRWPRLSESPRWPSVFRRTTAAEAIAPCLTWVNAGSCKKAEPAKWALPHAIRASHGHAQHRT
jgi:hypothetical protein